MAVAAMSEPPPTLPADRASAALDLPDDVWEYISDLVGFRALSHVCSRLWQLLHHRHLALHLTEATAFHQMDRLLSCVDRVQTLAVDGEAALAEDVALPAVRSDSLAVAGGLHNCLLLELAVLQRAQALSSLTLFFGGKQVSDGDVLTLSGTLQDLPCLRTLVLYLDMNDVGPRGATALASLGRRLRLQRLSLVLLDNLLGVDGAACLGALGEAAHLEALSLDVSNNCLGDLGAQGLVPLRLAPALRRLELNLAMNEVGDSGAEALATMVAGGGWRQCHLRLDKNRITVRGAGPLVRTAAAAPGAVTLDLSANPLSAEDVACLTAMAQHPSNPLFELVLPAPRHSWDA
eukprot:EG_transcript_13979